MSANAYLKAKMNVAVVPDRNLKESKQNETEIVDASCPGATAGTAIPNNSRKFNSNSSLPEPPTTQNVDYHDSKYYSTVDNTDMKLNQPSYQSSPDGKPGDCTDRTSSGHAYTSNDSLEKSLNRKKRRHISELGSFSPMKFQLEARLEVELGKSHQDKRKRKRAQWPFLKNIN